MVDVTKVEKQIFEKNSWYVGDQLAWSELPEIKPIYNLRKKFFASVVIKEKQRKSNLSVLDCGCGDGYWTSAFTQIGGLEVTGIDYNPVRLERAKKNAPKAKFIEGDIATLLAKENQQFDIIWFSQVIEHIEDDVSVLKQLHKLLKDDGVIVIGTTNEGSFFYEYCQRKTNYREGSDHIHFYTLGEIRKKIVTAGFKIEKSLYEPFFPGDEKTFYNWMRKPIKRKFLQILAKIFPGGCSDYYFSCRKK